MDAARITHRRMQTQRLTGPPLAAPEDVVGLLGAVQSQDHGPAKWSLGQRSACGGGAVDGAAVDGAAVDGAAVAAVEKAFADGAILRTHVLRPTWHFVLPEDIVWMLALTAPRVHATCRTYYRRLGLDEETFATTDRLIAGALSGGNQLTRKELGAVLTGAGVEGDAHRLGFLMSHAELEGIVCSGAPQGKQHTYALIADRAPQAKTLEPDEALAELTRRYFTGHGPATVKDFRWWSSLTIADIHRGLEMAGPDLHREEHDGVAYWSAAGAPAPDPLDGPRVHLLQTYDEYVVGYAESRALIDLAGTDKVMFHQIVLLDGQVAGQWKRTTVKDQVDVEVELYRPFDDRERSALETAAHAHGAFLGRSATLTVTGG